MKKLAEPEEAVWKKKPAEVEEERKSLMRKLPRNAGGRRKTAIEGRRRHAEAGKPDDLKENKAEEAAKKSKKGSRRQNHPTAGKAGGKATGKKAAA